MRLKSNRNIKQIYNRNKRSEKIKGYCYLKMNVFIEILAVNLSFEEAPSLYFGVHFS